MGEEDRCVAKCRLCGNEISFGDGDAHLLGQHLIEHHPETDVAHFFFPQTLDSSNSDIRSDDEVETTGDSSKKNSHSISQFILDSLPNLCRPHVVKTPKTTDLFKTTVETWSPGGDPLTCPNCKTHDHPYIRKQKNKVASNSLGAFCLLSCWPLCFFPMVMCGTAATTSLCCRQCGYCFGIYDQAKGTLQPPRTASNKDNLDDNNNAGDNKTPQNELTLDLECNCCCTEAT